MNLGILGRAVALTLLAAPLAWAEDEPVPYREQTPISCEVDDDCPRDYICTQTEGTSCGSDDANCNAESSMACEPDRILCQEDADCPEVWFCSSEAADEGDPDEQVADEANDDSDPDELVPEGETSGEKETDSEARRCYPESWREYVEPDDNETAVEENSEESEEEGPDEQDSASTGDADGSGGGCSVAARPSPLGLGWFVPLAFWFWATRRRRYSARH